MCTRVPFALNELQEFSKLHYKAIQNAAFLPSGQFVSNNIQDLVSISKNKNSNQLERWQASRRMANPEKNAAPSNKIPQPLNRKVAQNERKPVALEATAQRRGAAEENIMFDFTKDPLKDLRAFASFHSEALQNASLLLGGHQAVRRTQRLLDDISSAPQLTRQMSRELVVLHQLLSFHNVQEQDRIEAACFTDIDPASPVVADLCLLNEALKDQLYRLQCEHPFKDFDLLIAA